MKIHELELKAPKNSKRVGRGIGSGTGKTSGRGTKGQNSRTGGGVRPGFEGGQNPLAKRLPKKRGFKALAHVTYQVINLEDLKVFKAGQIVDTNALVGAGLIKNVASSVKLLGDGKLDKKLTVQVQAFSASAKSAITAVGGKADIIPLPKSPKLKSARNEAKVSKPS